ncbi:MAG: hypothetical protein CSA58_09365 [Micrococcales bacterium]|nr:MAG: hypothetical protein CSA58_09365 [Micrococcales bacterium]
MVLASGTGKQLRGTVSNVGPTAASRVRVRVSCEFGLGPMLAEAAWMTPESELPFAIDLELVDPDASRLIIDWRLPGGGRDRHAIPLRDLALLCDVG